jgi:hypothetical protein
MELVMERKHIWNVKDLANYLGKSPDAIYAALGRCEEGKSIPPGFRLGKRRYWIPLLVETWLIKQVESPAQEFPADHCGYSWYGIETISYGRSTHRTQWADCL